LLSNINECKKITAISRNNRYLGKQETNIEILKILKQLQIKKTATTYFTVLMKTAKLFNICQMRKQNPMPENDPDMGF
jgi:hypothetical protein